MKSFCLNASIELPSVEAAHQKGASLTPKRGDPTRQAMDPREADNHAYTPRGNRQQNPIA